ncbi:MAG: DEAD/DEAH box helicase family protein, partial [Lachnospiraceae bacterium]|nr:DEAD/DEAH box helicase family protein [Lachnospiraceae bacterium]
MLTYADEFHHAAAPIYKEPLEKFTSKILLGLTATPERMDGEDILRYFNNRIAAEIRLPEAIDRKLLCPFQYFGISDEIDYSEIKWSRGGYDRQELSNILSFSG